MILQALSTRTGSPWEAIYTVFLDIRVALAISLIVSPDTAMRWARSCRTLST